jgi:hypothetical protein
LNYSVCDVYFPRDKISYDDFLKGETDLLSLRYLLSLMIKVETNIRLESLYDTMNNDIKKIRTSQIISLEIENIALKNELAKLH